MKYEYAECILYSYVCMQLYIAHYMAIAVQYVCN